MGISLKDIIYYDMSKSYQIRRTEVTPHILYEYKPIPMVTEEKKNWNQIFPELNEDKNTEYLNCGKQWRSFSEGRFIVLSAQFKKKLVRSQINNLIWFTLKHLGGKRTNETLISSQGEITKIKTKIMIWKQIKNTKNHENKKVCSLKR